MKEDDRESRDDKDPRRRRTYVWCRDVTIQVLEGDDYKEVPAAQYMCEEDHSDLIIYLPHERRNDSPIKRSTYVIEELPVGHVLTGAIDQPLDADPDDDPATARVYSLIRAPHAPDYITYKCAHGAVKGQGFGVHMASSQQDIKECRDALGILAMKWQ